MEYSMSQRSTSSIQIYNDERLQKIYTFHKKLSNGCFGYLFLVTNKYTQKRTALKVELIKNEGAITLNKYYSILKKLQGIEGIPAVYGFGRTDKLLYLEMQLLEKDLSYLTEKEYKTNSNEICDIGRNLIQILQQVHSQGIVHRDLKPQNMMYDSMGVLYLIDFGISKEIKDVSVSHGRSSFVGTPRYASVNAHKGREQTFHDDLESLLYNLVFFCRKTLPWINMKAVNGDKLDAIMTVKMKKPKSELCRGLPNCFLMAFYYLADLHPSDKINYYHLAELFVNYRQKETTTYIFLSVEYPAKNNKKNIDRRVSISVASYFLEVPSAENQGVSSQATIDFCGSQQVMGSMMSLSPKAKKESYANIAESEMNYVLPHEVSVDKRMQQLLSNKTKICFYIDR